MDLQDDNLRKELGVATAGFRADVTGTREMVSMRLQKVDGQFKAVHADMDQRFDGVDQRLENVETPSARSSGRHGREAGDDPR